VGRPHIAAVLVTRRLVASVPEAFDRYLARGRPAYRDRPRLGAAEAARLTRASGGVAVVAHPHTVADDRHDFGEAFRRFAGLGIAGVECHYVEYPPEHRIRLADLAATHGLIATGGSDFHGRYKPGIAVGVGRGDLVVPDRVLDDLSAARPA
jgi:predicted metal-dependent phosphoesterase TrpH